MDYLILRAILSNTSCGKDYKNFALVCKQWYAVINELFPGGDVFCNHLLTLMAKFPDAEWNYECLAWNSNMTLDYIKAHPEKSWSYKHIIGKDYMYRHFLYVECLFEIDFSMIMEHPELDWNYGYPYDWKNIDWKYIENNPSIPWNYTELSCTPSIPWEFIVHNRDKSWDFDGLSEVLDISIILQNPNEPWVWENVNCNNSVNWHNIWLIPKDKQYIFIFCHSNESVMNGIEEYINYVDFDSLSFNKHITTEFIIKHIHKPWNFERLSYNPKLTWSVVKSSLDKPWNYDSLSMKRIPLNDLIKYNDKPWNYNLLSANATLDYVRALPDKLWNLKRIVEYSKLSYSDLDYIDEEYHEYISINTKLTWRFVVDNIDKIKWDFRKLSRNRFSQAC